MIINLDFKVFKRPCKEYPAVINATRICFDSPYIGIPSHVKLHS